MWSFIAQSGLAAGVVDLTNELALLRIGLVGLVVLSAGLLALTALRQRAVRLNTLDPQQEDSPGPGILDRKAPVDGLPVAEAAGSPRRVARAERHHAVAGLGKRP